MTPDWAEKPTNVPYATFGDPQTLNLYAYVENEPINRVDADGHIEWAPHLDFSNGPINIGAATAQSVGPSELATGLSVLIGQRVYYSLVSDGSGGRLAVYDGGQAAQQQQYLTKLASGIRLIPISDGTGTGTADRDILYRIFKADGGPYQGPDLWVNEHLDKPALGSTKIGNGDYSDASPSYEKNQWNDGLGAGLGPSLDLKQKFTVSGAPGLHPAISASIFVRYGGHDYGTLALHLGSDHVVTINGLTRLPTGP
jgi:hypothetical protein